MTIKFFGGFSKVNAPVEELIVNNAASAPPFNDQVTVSSALNV
mgnify:CR=1 FL=1